MRDPRSLPIHHTIAVPGTQRFITIGLADDHTIWIDRPGAADQGVPVPPTTYRWLGGLPDPTRPKRPLPRVVFDPGLAPDERAEAESEAWVAPVAAVARLEHGRALSADERKEVAAAWQEAWRTLGTHLHPQAAALAHRHGMDATTYAVFARRPDLLDFLRECPALIPFVTVARLETIPTSGWSLVRVIQHLLGNELCPPGSRISPGLLAWMRRMRWDASMMPPAMSSHPQTWRLEAQQLVRRAVAAGELFNADRISQLDSEGAKLHAEELARKKAGGGQVTPFTLDRHSLWVLLHTILDLPGATDLVAPVLQSPTATLRALVRISGRPGLDRGDGQPPANVAELLAIAVNDIAHWQRDCPDEARSKSSLKAMIEAASRHASEKARETHILHGARAEALAQLSARVAEIRQGVLARLEAEAAERAERLRRIEEGRKQAAENVLEATERLRRYHATWTSFHTAYPLRVPFPMQPVQRDVVLGGMLLRGLTTGSEVVDESLGVESGGCGHCIVLHIDQIVNDSRLAFTIRAIPADGDSDVPTPYLEPLGSFETSSNGEGFTEINGPGNKNFATADIVGWTAWARDVAIGKISLTEAEQGWAYTLLQAAEAPGLPPEEAFDLVEYSLGLTGEAQRQIAEALRDPARMTAARLQRRPITKQHHYALERQGKHGVRLETQRWLLVALGAEVLAPALRPFTPPTDIPPDLVRQEDGEPNDTPEPAADLADEMAVGDVGITPGRRVQ